MTNLKSKFMLVVVSLLLAACSSNPTNTANTAQTAGSGQPPAPPAALATREVATTSSVSVDGALALGTPTITLGFDTSSRVVSINAKAGHTVKKGEVLATLDDTTLKEAVADAELALQISEANITNQNAPATKEELTAAQAQLSAAYATYSDSTAGTTASALENARVNAEAAWKSYLSAQITRDMACGGSQRTAAAACKSQEATYGSAYESMLAARATYQNLQQPVSQNTLTQAYASVVSAKTKLESLNEGVTSEQTAVDTATVNQSRASLLIAQNNLSKATLVSPCDCVVEAVNIAVGVVPSSDAFTLVNLNGIQFTTSNLTEKDVASIKTNATATIRLKSYTDEFAGKVTAVLAQSSGKLSGEALYTVLITLDPTTRTLLPGMTGQASISLES